MATRCLVADDSSTMRKIILRSLNAVGVNDITEAADGEEAIKLFGDGIEGTQNDLPHRAGIVGDKTTRGHE